MTMIYPRPTDAHSHLRPKFFLCRFSFFFLSSYFFCVSPRFSSVSFSGPFHPSLAFLHFFVLALRPFPASCALAPLLLSFPPLRLFFRGGGPWGGALFWVVCLAWLFPVVGFVGFGGWWWGEGEFRSAFFSLTASLCFFSTFSSLLSLESPVSHPPPSADLTASYTSLTFSCHLFFFRFPVF